jgi:hypothetical protein
VDRAIRKTPRARRAWELESAGQTGPIPPRVGGSLGYILTRSVALIDLDKARSRREGKGRRKRSKQAMEIGIMGEEEAHLVPAPMAGEDDEADLLVERNEEEVVSRIRATANDAESAGLPMIKVAGDGKRMHLVSQQFINELKSGPPFFVPRRLSNERLLRFVRGDQAKYATMIKGYEAAEAVRDMEMGILEQYHDKGYAYFVIADEV